MNYKSMILYSVIVLCALSCSGQNESKPKVEDSKDSELKMIYSSQLYGWNDDGSLELKDSTETQGIFIQNSFPKGDRYVHPSGRDYGAAVFWARIVNHTDTPVEIHISFPADSFLIPPLPGAFFKLFLPPDIMTVERESMYNYGAEGLRAFLDSNLYKSTKLDTLLNPGDEHLFYISMVAQNSSGVLRNGLVLKEEGLFYNINIIPHYEDVYIPCGNIEIKN